MCIIINFQLIKVLTINIEQMHVSFTIRSMGIPTL